MFNKKILILFPLILLVACNVQKRKYQKGFYVDWHNKTQQKEKTNSVSLSTETKPVVAKEIHPETVTTEPLDLAASVSNGVQEFKFEKNTWLKRSPEDSCDVIVYKDGSEIKSKVQEITTNEIKYKRCDAMDGPMYVSKKSEVFMIKYANGTREIIKAEAQEIKTYVPPERGSRTERLRKRQTHPLAIAALVFGILSLVTGYIGLILLLGVATEIGLIPLVLSLISAIAAVTSGRIALKAIKEAPDVFKGKGQAIPGFIMGMVVLGIMAVILLITVLVLFLLI
jgi:hypothetical protein